jgi:L-amino acid N-acyltransferase YncA
MDIRSAALSDALRVAEIYNQGIVGRLATFETTLRTAEDILAWFSPQYPFLVAERDGLVLGFARASSYRPRDCYAGIAEYSVYVATDAQGQRVGDALMREFLPALRLAGFWKVLSRVFPENTASLALCRRHGFREVGTYEKHAQLDGVWRDVVIVERLLLE